MANLSPAERESVKTRLFRLAMNAYPIYFGTGGRVTFIASDWSEIHVRLKLSVWTRNYVGTLFGGSLFAATDPFYMLMAMHQLGRNFIVWDKAAHIRFLRPGTGTACARLTLDPKLVEELKSQIEQSGELEREFTLTWTNTEGKPVAEIRRLLYFATREHYSRKRERRSSREPR